MTDRVFVHDLVLPVNIGAYAHEHGQPQRVRFDVSVQVARPAAQGRVQPARDMRDIYSYDIVSDGIRMLIAAGHVDLVETLAEQIAEVLLGDPRVVSATVQVTKLDTGSGHVGVAIERARDTLYGPHCVTMAALVAKLGGSLAASALLPDWLDAISGGCRARRAGAGRGAVRRRGPHVAAHARLR